MSNNEFGAISQGKKLSNTKRMSKLTSFAEIANLDINNGARDPFAMYDTAPPPAPKLKSKGVIAMDITEQFANAAQRTCYALVQERWITC